MLALCAPHARARDVYVANQSAGSVSVLDSNGNTVLATIATGTMPSAVEFTPDGTRAYVANQGSNTISVIDASSRTVTSTFSVGDTPMDLAFVPDGSRAYITNYVADTLSVVDTGANSVIATIPVGSHPLKVLVSPDGNTVYVLNQSGRSISVIDAASNAVTATIPLSLPGAAFPYAMTVTPDGKYIYVGVIDSMGPDSGVYVVDAVTHSSSAPIAPAYPQAVIASPDGEHVYTADLTQWLRTIDVATNTISATINVGGDMRAIAMMPDSGSAFVVGYTGLLRKVDLLAGTSTLVQSFGGNALSAVAVRPDQGPTAALAPPSSTDLGSATSFDASASTDTDGTIARFVWDFGDGHTATTTAPRATHTYTAIGSYVATVTAIDDEGCSNAQRFTGRSAPCNGSSRATSARSLTVKTVAVATTPHPAPPAPVLESVAASLRVHTAARTTRDGMMRVACTGVSRISKCTFIVRDARGHVLGRGTARGGHVVTSQARESQRTLTAYVRISRRALTQAQRMIPGLPMRIDTTVWASQSPLVRKRSTARLTTPILVISPRFGTFRGFRHTLTPAGHAFFASIARQLPRAHHVTCTGYTAGVIPTSANARALAKQRAQTVCALLHHSGMHARFAIVGAGTANPHGNWNSMVQRRLSRNVTLTITR